MFGVRIGEANSVENPAVALPEFDVEGDLPKGVHRATLFEVLERFGHGSLRRRSAADRLVRIHQLACSTGQVARFVIFGSFITAKEEPNDVDIILVMLDSFDLATVAGEAALVFQHSEADAHLEPVSSGPDAPPFSAESKA